MERLLLNVKLDIEPVTWGGNDAQKRRELREAIRKEVPQFNEQYIESLLRNCSEISIVLNCYLIDPQAKDIDNLAKIPIDSVFFSAQNERGHTQKWESRITSLTMRKFRSLKNSLEIMLYQTTSGE